MKHSILRSSLFEEGVWSLLRNQPFNILWIIPWIISRTLKKKVDHILNTKDLFLPINETVVSNLKKFKENGRPIYLDCGNYHKIGESLVERFECFSGIFGEIASKDRHNFAYLTSSKKNRKIWKNAKEIIFVDDKHVHKTPSHILKNSFRALRVHQWLKSILVVLPLFISYRYLEIDLWISALKAFITFNIISSSIYVINDLFDLEADRKHPENKRRPFAAGEIPLYWGVYLYVLLTTIGLIGSWNISDQAFRITLLYASLGLLYSIYLKRIPLMDTVLLAIFHILRVFFGAVVLDIHLSNWIYVVFLSFFFSLAHLKRVTELSLFKEGLLGRRRGYVEDDRVILTIIGVVAFCCGCMSYLLYLQFENRSEEPLLWSISGILSIWFIYLWMGAWRGSLQVDLVKFTLKDALSYVFFSLTAIIWLLATP